MRDFDKMMEFLHNVDYAEHGRYKDGYVVKSDPKSCVVREIDRESCESRVMFERPMRVLGIPLYMKRSYFYKSNLDIAEWYAMLNVLQLLNEKHP